MMIVGELIYTALRLKLLSGILIKQLKPKLFAANLIKQKMQFLAGMSIISFQINK